MTATLYHFTCERAAAQIESECLLRPFPQSVMGGLPVIWLSEFRNRDRQLAARIGLGSTHALRGGGCDVHCNPVYARYSINMSEHELRTYVQSYVELNEHYPQAASTFRAMGSTMPWRWRYCLVPIRLYLTNGGRCA